MISEVCNRVFKETVQDYHRHDSVDTAIANPYKDGSFEFLLYQKNYIDTVQWHLEDIIRNPQIDPVAALQLKRRIDASNQERTDLVEFIDGYFLHKYREVKPLPGATTNTESPAWAIDRLSILMLKIFHMQEEVNREDASLEHRQLCDEKLKILLQQQEDLGRAIDELLEEIAAGKKYMKLYRQMKMYNDPSLNPVLYAGKK